MYDRNIRNANVHQNLPAQLRGFGAIGIISILLILFTGNISVANIVIPVGALLVLLWVRLANIPWKDIGYSKPDNWITTILLGILIGTVCKLLMKALVMPVLDADPINRYYHYLTGNKTLLPFAVWAMILAGFAEETVFRGYMFERLARLLKNNKGSNSLILLITSILFAFAHYTTQGIAGVEQAVITGLLFGSIYMITGTLWMSMIAHAVFDLTALALIYFDVEAQVAHWIFK